MAVRVALAAAVLSLLAIPVSAARARLGVTVADGEGAVVVTSVVAGSAAERAGLLSGDVLVRVDGREIRSAGGLSAELRRREPHEAIELVVRRDGAETTLAAELEARPERHARRHDRVRIRIDRATPRLGIEVQPLTDGLREHFGVRAGRGLLVAGVEADSAAAVAGVEPGDVLVEVDGNEIADRGDVRRLLAGRAAGERVELGVVRDRVPTSLWATLAEAERTESDFVLPGFHVEIEGLDDEEREEIRRELAQARREIRRAIEEIDGEVADAVAEAMEEVARALRDDVGPAIREALESIPDVEIEIESD